MTREELQTLPATINLTTAARALGCGRTLAYDLARRDQFPCRVLRVGTRYLVPTADLLRTLGIADEPRWHRPDRPSPSDGDLPGEQPLRPPRPTGRASRRARPVRQEM